MEAVPGDFIHQIEVCAKSVYESLGTGHSESVYHRAMEVELRFHDICYESKVTLPIVHRGLTVGYGEADLIVYERNVDGTVAVPGVIVELKAVTHEPREVERAQLMGYLRSRGWPDASGVIINFRQPCGAKPADKVDFVEILL